MHVHMSSGQQTLPKCEAAPARPRTISGASNFKIDFDTRTPGTGQAPSLQRHRAPVVTETHERSPTSFDFGKIPIHAPIRDKSVDGGETIDNGMVQDKDGDAGSGQDQVPVRVGQSPRPDRLRRKRGRRASNPSR